MHSYQWFRHTGHRASIGHQSDDDDHSFKKLNPPQVTPLPFDQVTDIELVCEMDEQWSFVQRKQQQCWLWYAWSPQFKRVFAYALGERTDETCKQLLKRLARRTICFSKSIELHDKVIGEYIRRHSFQQV